MMMEKETENGVSAQGNGPPRARRVGDTVPVPGTSSSNDGPSAGLRASPTEEMVIATDSDGGSSERLSGGDDDAGDSSLAPSSDGAGTAKASTDRGRPPTTGEYVGLAKAQQKLAKAIKETEYYDEIEKFLDAGWVPSTTRRMREMPKEEELLEQMRDLCSSELEKRARTFLSGVERVANTSSYLQGPFKGILRKAAANSKRVTNLELDSKRLEEEMAALKVERTLLPPSPTSLTGQSPPSKVPKGDNSPCSAAPKYPLCADLGRPAGHRLGAKGCAPVPLRVAKGDGSQTVPRGKRLPPAVKPGGLTKVRSKRPPDKGKLPLTKSRKSELRQRREDEQDYGDFF
ncbi:gag-like protein [Lasius niger]|uniref:Gag-like protein n=1 Tax=Lasius niger TaxID=67767 RepID=A0A0J7KW72_LASNI|nr:gag-like protein [Lasius niger]